MKYEFVKFRKTNDRVLTIWIIKNNNKKGKRIK